MARRAKAVQEPEEVPDELAGMSVQELNELIDRATAARDAKIDSARQEFIERTRSEAEELGLSLQDLMPATKQERKKPGNRGPSAPNTALQTARNGVGRAGRRDG